MKTRTHTLAEASAALASLTTDAIVDDLTYELDFCECCECNECEDCADDARACDCGSWNADLVDSHNGAHVGTVCWPDHGRCEPIISWS